MLLIVFIIFGMNGSVCRSRQAGQAGQVGPGGPRAPYTTTVYVRATPAHDRLVDDFFVIDPFIVQ